MSEDDVISCICEMLERDMTYAEQAKALTLFDEGLVTLINDIHDEISRAKS